MAYGIVHYFPNGTKEQYEKSLAAVHPSRDSLPKGQLYHAAGASEGGWTVIAVHEDKKSWEKFRDEILMPRMKQGIHGGLPTPAQTQEFEIYNLQQAGKLSDRPEGRLENQL